MPRIVRRTTEICIMYRAAMSENVPSAMYAQKYSDQPVHSQSLIRIFTVRILDSRGRTVSSCG